MVRTMELILGLPPLSQYDAAARPMFHSFVEKADLAPFTHRDARVKLDEMNPGTGPDARASAAMDFAQEDRAPEIALNAILWRSIHGPNAVMPPPRHAAFIRPLVRGDAGDGDDDDVPAPPRKAIRR